MSMPKMSCSSTMTELLILLPRKLLVLVMLSDIFAEYVSHYKESAEENISDRKYCQLYQTFADGIP